MDELIHYGMPRRSGRYPWGSGGNAQRSKEFLSYVNDLRSKGLTEVEIAKGMGMTTSQLRARKSIEKDNSRTYDVAEAIKLKDKGYSNVAIGQKMGINESSVRSLLDPSIQIRSQITNATATVLKDNISEKGYIDVGVGVETHLGISRTKLKTAIAQLEMEGYTVHYIQVDQLGVIGNKTSVMVLAPPDTTYLDVSKNRDRIGLVNGYSEDGGRTYLGLEPVTSITGDRIYIRYDEDGGGRKDGVIELRNGVDDISLGNSKYAQVRIAVDGESYLKGMAMYGDIPEGYDIVFNTNKSKGTPPTDVYKSMKDDVDNPFGATVRQRHYIDKNGKEQLSALNIVNEEGDWSNWSKTLSSQMLSKQTPALAKQQLKLSFDIKQDEYDEIMRLTNPAVRKKLLDSFADDCDASAVHLKAAAMPRQRSHVILPINGLKENEIYAPNYRDGEEVVLIRYPHGGTFEIPQLRVNNRHKEANALMKGAKDAVGINSVVAERLSGADFDGDTVLVIPNKNKTIKTSSPLKGLQNFDPKQSYPKVDGMKKMKSMDTQREMGKISNLITDMHIKGATDSEISRAVRHSMVVIDAEKHGLNYTKSSVDNGITELKRKYQGGPNAGASTLISKASSEARPNTRKEKIDPRTGKKVYEYTDESYVNKKGKTVYKTMKSTKMAETEDAYSISSGTVIESTYANHANKLKSLANKARKDSIATKTTPYSPSAKTAYQKEVDSLRAKLNIAIKNKPLERQAQLLANTVVSIKKKDNPEMTKDELKRLNGQALTEARARTGAKKQQIDLTSKEWAAIQAGAISNNTLTQILNNTDLDKVKTHATPRTKTGMSTAKANKAKAMLSRGYTQSEIADALGISLTTLQAVVD